MFLINSLFTVDVSRYLNAQYVALIDDVSRTLVVQITISVLLALSFTDTPVSPGVVFQMVMYAAVGICMYYLVFQKLVSFR